MKTQRCIVSGTRREYDQYIQENNLDPNDYTYISGIDTLMGRTNIEVLFIGTFYLRDDLYEILQQLEARRACKKREKQKLTNQRRNSTAWK